MSAQKDPKRERAKGRKATGVGLGSNGGNGGCNCNLSRAGLTSSGGFEVAVGHCDIGSPDLWRPEAEGEVRAAAEQG